MTGDNTTSMSGHQAPAPGAESVRHCHAALLKLQDESPEWFAAFEDCDPDLCPKGELMTLMDTAPTMEARMFLYGKLTLRQAISEITGRPLL
jgi:hypothetical protein